MMDRYSTHIFKLECPECGLVFELNDDDLEYGNNVCPSCLLPAKIHRE